MAATSRQQFDTSTQRQKANPKDMKRLMRRMRSLKNEMDLLEILSNFWPLPNMEARVDRLEQEMDALNQVYTANRHLVRR